MEPVIRGKLRYVAAGHVPEVSPHNFHLPAMSEFSDDRLLPLHSMRPVPTVSELSTVTNHAQLSTHGFMAVHHPTTLHSPPYNRASWKDHRFLREHYIAESAGVVGHFAGR
ncbi:uncharacterized protein BCR38DRAFT_487696 [Pseudomassariella vexata]|uniref:Uncharacterized protein n=1 Tax=Pseudomassariella vexata TaxID=1141098 RepID=A0A1Y2DN17_9PEZI|nr:uncharacterized protein BCR38DRAFT_487696 [Pseudomassariella vexata]ORY60640.1 hypothetical protein BCR38DRAFT_487696 [Pseudomassariella vexata]